MIFILSDTYDTGTSQVIDWLIEKNAIFYRHNSTSEIKKVSFEIANDNDTLVSKLNDLDINNISVFWYRKGDFSNSFILKNNKILNITKFLYEEFSALKDYILYILNKKKRLGNFFNKTPNKLITLEIAKDCGLKIPNTNIMNQSEDICLILNKQKNITKSIQDAFYLKKDSMSIVNFTNMVDVSFEFNTVFPSLLQKKIEKKIELRIVFINDKCFSSALFSQSRSSSRVDSRKLQNETPYRVVPFRLPSKQVEKVICLMKNLDLNFGVIDMIIGNDNEYYFLEVNPCGQFSFVSIKCNYYLEKIIASFLNSK